MTALELLRLYLADTNPDVDKRFFTDPTLEALLDAADDVYGAAAEGWLIKSADVAKWYSVTIDGSTMSRDQVFKHCMDMREHYLGISVGGGRLSNTRLQVTPVPETETSEFA